MVGLRRQLQPAQLFAARLGQPGQHSSYLRAAKQLFGGPQGVGVAVCAHQQQLAGVQSLCLKRAEAGLERRVHQSYALVCCAQAKQCLQRWQQQPPFQPGQGAEQFGQLPARPATTGEFGV